MPYKLSPWLYYDILRILKEERKMECKPEGARVTDLRHTLCQCVFSLFLPICVRAKWDPLYLFVFVKIFLLLLDIAIIWQYIMIDRHCVEWSHSIEGQITIVAERSLENTVLAAGTKSEEYIISVWNKTRNSILLAIDVEQSIMVNVQCIPSAVRQVCNNRNETSKGKLWHEVPIYEGSELYLN